MPRPGGVSRSRIRTYSFGEHVQGVRDPRRAVGLFPAGVQEGLDVRAQLLRTGAQLFDLQEPLGVKAALGSGYDVPELLRVFPEASNPRDNVLSAISI